MQLNRAVATDRATQRITHPVCDAAPVAVHRDAVCDASRDALHDVRRDAASYALDRGEFEQIARNLETQTQT